MTGDGLRGKERVESYRDLRVWQAAMNLAVLCYRETEALPKAELYGLTSQLRRAAGSVPANIAEGKGRYHLNEYLHHLSIAHGSLLELETHVELSRRLEYLPEDRAAEILHRTMEVGQMLNALANALRRTRHRAPDTGHRTPETSPSDTRHLTPDTRS